MNNCKRNKEDIKIKLDKGIYTTCPKANTATANWWKSFVRIQDDKKILYRMFNVSSVYQFLLMIQVRLDQVLTKHMLTHVLVVVVLVPVEVVILLQ